MTETHYKIKGCPVRVALLTDTHNTDPGPILASLRAHSPVLIAHAGDFVQGRKPKNGIGAAESRNAITLLRGCAGIAPTFVSIGNHEAYLSPADHALVLSTGATLLDNRFVTYVHGTAKVVVGGLSSGYYTAYQRHGTASPDGERKAFARPRPDTGWLEEYAAADGYHILLTHHPEYFHLIPPSVELAMAGHAHGGQWRFYDLRAKAWRGVYAPDQGLFPALTGGVVEGRLVIGRGLCNTLWIPRIHNDTEIIYIDGR